MTAGLKSLKSSHKIQTWPFRGKLTLRNIYMLFRDYKSTNTLAKTKFNKLYNYAVFNHYQFNYLQESRCHINFISCIADYFNQTTM